MERLPSFIGIGPARTGSTWLHHALGEVAGLPSEKESNFFSDRYHKGIRWYAKRFVHLDTIPIGEICPYFSSVDAIDRIHEYLPDCKIICTLRDPVDRAYSHYKLLRREGYAAGGFEETIATQVQPSEGNRYAFYLRKWQERFGNDRVLVTIYDDLRSDPQAHLNQVCDFIGAQKIVLVSGAFPGTPEIISSLSL